MSSTFSSSSQLQMIHICFDLDGTLCSSTNLGFQSTNLALKTNGKRLITLEEYESCTRYDTITRFGVHLNNGCGPTDDPEILSEARRIGGEFENQYTALVSPATAPFFKGALEHLKTLKSPTTTFSILTNAKKEYAEKVRRLDTTGHCTPPRIKNILNSNSSLPSSKVLDVNECTSLFTSVHGADSAQCSKPLPGGLNLIMSENSATPQNTIFVGDSLSDGEAGVNTGCRTVGCSWGAGKRDDLIASGFFTEGVVDDVETLFSTLKNLIPPTSASVVDLQSDCGRGQEHLSARLEEGDVCVYQVGTWMVDSVSVGPGEPPRLLLARVDCLQINWTTDCEHGRILATPVSTRQGDALHIDKDVEYAGVEFGPDQLIARLPVAWADEYAGTLLAPLPEMLPASLLEKEELIVETAR
ncbi:hypothetical protein TL16_g06834 [Triparma laevis f. inornata]|uniref:Haloacid dehalogenase-like hydrolase n=1 Tax=Triparma laevis f. inornata TaxID=1714386 RepID=A0A9W7AV54_9STRA|nr:hypothetical protein TL16_g06834 [Triparma laevis f. inornata]